jgi:predicted phage terminase large subunit-like protein
MLEFIPALSPSFASPHHLSDWLELIERADREPIRGLCSIPIRHWKTESTVHGIVWLLMQDPERRIMFLTHSFDAAKKWGKRIRQLAEAMDHIIGEKGTVGPTRGWNEIAEWRNESGGGVVVMSADQSKIGYDCHVLIVDDAIDEHGSKDPVKREEVDQSITFYGARCVRNGVRGPILLVASRFHPDDPTGRRLARTAVDWLYVKHSAIELFCNECGVACDSNLCQAHPSAGTFERAFADAVLPLPALREIREELRESDPLETVWHAQYQNDPHPEGSDLFGSPTFYTTLPDYGYRVCHGVDFAYTDAPGADFFAAVSGRIYGRKLYILDVQRHRLDATLLETTCKRVISTHGRAPMWSYMSGPEVGLARLLIQRGVPVAPMKAKYNKLVRAQKTIRRWNDGDILVPELTAAPWVRGFLHRVSMFRGHDKDRDDEIDAIVSCADANLGGATGSAGKLPGAHSARSGLLG